MSPRPTGEAPAASVLVEVCLLRGSREHCRTVTFPSGVLVGQVPCAEWGGTGW
jgi:hypothetical protein